MFAEDTATALAHDVSISNLGNNVFLHDRIAGPSGEGLILDEETGTNVALAECVYGFGSAPVLVEEYVLVPLYHALDGTVELGPSLNQGQTPVYVTCTNVKKPCDPGATFYYCSGLPTDATSFGAIKSLFQR